MLRDGALDEVRALLERRLDPALPAMRAHGVPELAAHLAGRMELAEARTRAVAHTRQYIKRQDTWFRHHALAPARRVRHIDARSERRHAIFGKSAARNLGVPSGGALTRRSMAARCAPSAVTGTCLLSAAACAPLPRIAVMSATTAASHRDPRDVGRRDRAPGAEGPGRRGHLRLSGRRRASALRRAVPAECDPAHPGPARAGGGARGGGLCALHRQGGRGAGHLGAGRDQCGDGPGRRADGQRAGRLPHRPGADPSHRQRRVPGGGHHRHHAPGDQAQLPRQGHRQALRRDPRGLLRGAFGPARPGGDRPAEGHPDRQGQLQRRRRRCRTAAIGRRPSRMRDAIRQAVRLLRSAKRPVVYAGGGVINSGPEASRLLDGVRAPDRLPLHEHP